MNPFRLRSTTVLWIAAASLLIAGSLAVVVPAETRLDATRRQTATDIARIAADRAFIAHREEAESLIRRVADDLHEANVGGDGTSPIGALLVELMRVAAADGVTIVDVTPDETTIASVPTATQRDSTRSAISSTPTSITSAAFVEQRITVRERGSFAATERFLRDLSLMRSLLRVDRVSLTADARARSPDDDRTPPLDGTIAVALERTAEPITLPPLPENDR